MKGAILAFIACLLVTGSAGIAAKNNAAAAPAAEQTSSTGTAAYGNDPSTQPSSAESLIQQTNTATVQEDAISGNTQAGIENTTAESNGAAPQSRAAASKAAIAGTVSSKSAVPNTTSQTSSCPINAAEGCKRTDCPARALGGCQNNSCTTDADGLCNINDCLTAILGNYEIGNIPADVLNGWNNSSSCPNSIPTNGNSSTAAPVSPSASSAADTGTGKDFSSFQNQVVQLVNQERTSRGLNALKVNTALAHSATLKSEDMAKLNYFDHNSPTYGSPFEMMQQLGINYRTAGENIAKGQTTPEQVMQGWMNSDGHRKNILNPSFTEIGVGIAKNSQGQYIWTQQFIG